MLDVLIWTALCGIVLEVIAPSLFTTSKGGANDQMIGIVLLPIAMVLDALVYAIFRNTPGKWLCGIQVLSVTGQRTSPSKYLHRNFKIYVFGLAFGIGLIALFTLIHSYRKVASEQLVSWDKELDTRALRVRGGTWRTVVTASLYLLLLVSLIALGVSAANSTPEQQLQDAAESINKSAPKMIDEATRLDGAEVDPGLVLQYNYTLVRVSGNETELAAVNLELQAALHQKVAEFFCTSADLRPLRDFGGTLRYRYSDKSGQVVGAIGVSNSDCSRTQ